MRDKKWWASSSIRIVHSELDPERITRLTKTRPSLSFRPGESKIHYGGSVSAGYWLVEHRVIEPDDPGTAFEWVESFGVEHEKTLTTLLSESCEISVYIGIHTQLVSLGFNLCPLPTLWRLNIPVGIEIFAG